MKKTKVSKRLLSILMALLMIVTSVPLFALPASAATATKKLFEYSFDTATPADNGDNLDSVDNSTAYSIDIDNSNGASDYWDWFDTDHYYFVKSWAKGDVNDNIRSSSYNKNWSIDVSFYLNSIDTSYSDEWVYALALYNAANTDKPFGLTLNGNVRYAGTTLDGGSDVYSFSNGKQYTVTYTYHDGIFNAYVENVTDSAGTKTKVFAYNCTGSTYQTLLESIQGVAIGGWWHNFTTMSIFNLVAYSYQDNSSADSHLKARYFNTSSDLTKDAKGSYNLTQVGSGITWDNTNGATFPSSNRDDKAYFKVATSAMLSKADETTGFTITFKAKAGTNEWERFFDYMTGTVYSSGASDNNFLFIAPNFRANLCARHTSSTEQIGEGNGGSYDTDEHTWAIVVVDGGYKLYCDGVFKACYANTAVDAAWFKSMIDNGSIYIGASAYSNDKGLHGSIKDFRVYDTALTSTQLLSVYADSLQACINIFEARIADMAANGYDSMWTNIGPAYECYKAAKVAVNNDGLAAFQTALENMQPFEPYVAEGTPAESTDYSPELEYFNGIIYSEPATKVEEDVYADAWSSNSTTNLNKANASWVYGTHVYLYYQNTVLLYDGVRDHTPSIPVNIGLINEDHRYAVKLQYLYPDEEDFELTTQWNGYDDSFSFVWPENDDPAISNEVNDNKDSDTADWSTNHNYKWNGNEKTGDTYYCQLVYRTYKNSLSYSGTPTEAYSCYSSTDWNARAYFSMAGVTNHIEGTLTDNDPDIVIINYKKLLDKLEAAADDTTGDSNSNSVANRTALSNLTTTYTEGGLENMFRAFDFATSLNPNNGGGISYYDYSSKSNLSHTYNYSTNMDSAALLCAGDIDASVAMLGSIKLSADHVLIGKIEEAIADYESTMKTMSGLHKNLKAAYDAYLDAVECVDGYRFGDATFADGALNTIYNNLVNATSAMTSWSAPTVLSSGIKFEDSSDISSSYYKNILYWGWSTAYGYLYADDQTTYPTDDFPVAITTETSGSQYSRASVSYPEAVLLYDGQDDHIPKIPIMAATIRRRQSNNRYMFYLYPTETNSSTAANDYFALDDQWHGEATVDHGNKTAVYMYWTTVYALAARSNNQRAQLSNVTFIQAYHKKSGTTNYDYAARAANTMSYIGEGDTTNYYESIYLPWIVQLGSSYSTTDDHYGTSSVPIHVINYEPVLEKINALTINAGDLDVTNYKEGGLGTWFNQLDALSAIDPSSYDYSLGISSAVSSCGTAIKNAVNTTNGTAKDMATSIDQASANSSAITADTVTSDPYTYDNEGNITGHIAYANATTPYQKLKIAILEAEDAPTTQGCVLNDVWADYTSAYPTYTISNGAVVVGSSQGSLQCAKEAMAKVVPAQYDGYAKTYTAAEISALADYLHNSIAALSVYTNSAHPLKYTYADGDKFYFQCNSNNSHIVDHNNVDDDYSTTDISADATVYNELGIVYKTLDLTKYSDKTDINAGLTTYNAVKTAPQSTSSETMLALDEAGKVQAIVDNGVIAMLTGINSANEGDANTYDITFNVYTVEDNVASAEPAYTQTYSGRAYGSTLDLNPVTNDGAIAALAAGSTGITAENMGILKWELVTGTGATEKTREFSQKYATFTAFVQEDATVNVYVTKLVPSSQVAILNMQGYTAYVLNISDNTTLSISSNALNTVTIGGASYNVPNTLSYDVSGWRIGGNMIANSETSVSTTIGELKALYNTDTITLTPNKALNNRTASDSYTFTLDGATVASGVAYDQKLTVTTEVEGAYAIVVNDEGKYIPVVYCDENVNSYTFNACRSLEFYTMYQATENGPYLVDLNGSANGGVVEASTDDETLFFYDHKLPFAYSFIVMTGTQTDTIDDNIYGNKWTTYSAFTQNCSISETEFGTLRTTATVSSDEFTLDNVGTNSIVKMAAKSKLYYSNQYSYSLSTSNTTPRVVNTRAYVKFTYTYTYGGNNYTIDAVAYGTPCVSYYKGVSA